MPGALLCLLTAPSTTGNWCWAALLKRALSVHGKYGYAASTVSSRYSLRTWFPRILRLGRHASAIHKLCVRETWTSSAKSVRGTEIDRVWLHTECVQRAWWWRKQSWVDMTTITEMNYEYPGCTEKWSSSQNVVVSIQSWYLTKHRDAQRIVTYRTCSHSYRRGRFHSGKEFASYDASGKQTKEKTGRTWLLAIIAERYACI